MGWVIALIVAAAILAGIGLALRRNRLAGRKSGRVATTVEDAFVSPAVAEFNVIDGVAHVRFEIPLPPGDPDPVLADLMGKEAVEVVREKRHSLPLDDVTRVVAHGRRRGEWAEVTAISLRTPGELPAPMRPELIPRAGVAAYDPLDRIADLPSSPPGLSQHRSDERLAPIGAELTLPAAIEAGLRSQGIDPARGTAGDVVLGLMRMIGFVVIETSEKTSTATRAGRSAFVRVVDHEPGTHPELSEPDIDRFVVDFVTSRADRGLLVSEKYCPFEVYDRERRDPRMRFVTRERIQGFVDALALS